jgi:hypothetical protein
MLISLLFIAMTAQAAATSPSPTQPSQAATTEKTDAPQKMIRESVFIQVAVKTPLSSKKMKVGDSVTFDSLVDVKSATGELLIPKHSNLTGTVTLVEPKDKATKLSKMAIKVTKAEWKGGSIALVAFFAGQINTPEGSTQMISGGPNPRAASPLEASSLMPMENVAVERDDAVGTVLVGTKRELDIPRESTMLLTTVPQ